MSPSDRSTRREFIAITSSAALGAAVPLAGGQPDAPIPHPALVPVWDEIPYSSEQLFDNAPQRTFSGDSATQIAMPLGGIGAGCICLNGYGGLQDFSIWNHPSTTALPEGYASSQAAFAILHIKGASPITKLVEGPFPILKIYDQGLRGRDIAAAGSKAFPDFKNAPSKENTPLERSSSETHQFRCRSPSALGIPSSLLMTRTQGSPAPSWSTRFITARPEVWIMNSPIISLTWHPDVATSNRQAAIP